MKIKKTIEIEVKKGDGLVRGLEMFCDEKCTFKLKDKCFLFGDLKKSEGGVERTERCLKTFSSGPAIWEVFSLSKLEQTHPELIK